MGSLLSRAVEVFKSEYARQTVDPLSLARDSDGPKQYFPRWRGISPDDVRTKMRNRDPLRWNRMEKDMAWLRRQCIKEGLDPETARWLL